MRISGCSAQGSAPRQFLAMLMPRSPVQTPGKRGGKRLPQGLLRESYLAEVGLKPIFILALGVELVGLGCDLDPMHWDEPTWLPGDAGAPRARRLALKIHAFSALHWLFAFFFVNTSCFVEEGSAFSLRADLGSFNYLGYSLV